MMKRIPSFPIVVAVLFRAWGAVAADWPMWRYDAARSAASPHGIELENKPVLLWSLALPPVRPAWPRERLQRLNFDASYEPVIMDKRMFLGFANDGSVRAYDTETGAEQWVFFTEGPVRCAPVGWNGKVYVGSDDGYLYCLDARTGAVVWKFRGAPPDRPDRRQLGNGRLVSFWPVRGGPVVADEIVYFGAGIWPIAGVFLHALDAETGRVIWANPDLHYIAGVRGQAAYRISTGLSSQGHLAFTDGKLAVPCGRSMPAGLDAATGELIYYDQGTRRGHSRIALHGDYVFVGPDGLMNLDRFIEIGTLGQAGYLPYKMVAGCDASSAFADGVAYGSAAGIFYAYDVTDVGMVERVTEYGNRTLRTEKWEPTIRWQFATPEIGRKSGVTIKAGKHVYGSAGNEVMALQGLGGPPRILWKVEVEGTPSSLAAADNKLFVATEEGVIYCFGAGRQGPAIQPSRVALPEAEDDADTEKIREIIAIAAGREGYALVLGLDNGKWIEALVKQTDMRVIAVDADPEKIEALRHRYADADLLGARVELFVAQPFEFLFPPYLAGLIVSEDPVAAGFSAERDGPALFNLLRPYGGALCLELAGDLRSAFEAGAQSAAPAGASIQSEGRWSLWTREGALPGSASWSHQGGDAANTYSSRDQRVRSPLGFLWYDDIPLPQGAGEFVMNALVHGGLVYVQGPRPGGFEQSMYDAYTGQVLWTNTVPARARTAPVVFADDGIYLAVEDRCLVFDPRSGAPTQTFSFAPPETPARSIAQGMRVEEDIILLMLGDGGDWLSRGGGGYADVVGQTLVCLDRQTGVELWRRVARERFHEKALAVGNGRVYFVDSMPTWFAARRMAPEDLKTVGAMVLALDARSGAEVWSRKVFYDATRTWTARERSLGLYDLHVPYRHAGDWLSFSAENSLVVAGRFLLGSAWDAGTGTPRWEQQEMRLGAPVMVRGNTRVGSSGNVYDIFTGESMGRFEPMRHRSCSYATGSEHIITVKGSYYDVEQETLLRFRNIRTGCLNNMIAADGLLNMPDFDNHCICNYPIQTSVAMMHMPEIADWSGEEPVTMTPPAQPLPADTPTN